MPSIHKNITLFVSFSLFLVTIISFTSLLIQSSRRRPLVSSRITNSLSSSTASANPATRANIVHPPTPHHSTVVASSRLQRNYTSMSSLPLVEIKKIAKGLQQSEGSGARVCRTIGNPRIADVHDPFLLLDEFNVTPKNGFPDHPHRGFETITYMLEGTFTHKDNAGHEGTIPKGGIQWMTAGRGIIHSETPGPAEVNRGLQLWVNLKSKDKMVPPAYQELGPEGLPQKDLDNGAHLTVVGGTSHGLESPVKMRTEMLYTHVVGLQSGKSYEEIVPKGMQGFVYVISGKGTVADGKDSKRDIGTKEVMLFNETSNQSRIVIESTSPDMEFAVIAGEPMKEPVARAGPMVMNTNEELRQAFLDFHMGKFTST